MTKFYADLHLNGSQLIDAVLHNSATDPQNPSVGQVYFNTTDKKTKQFDGDKWIVLGEDTTGKKVTVSIKDVTVAGADGTDADNLISVLNAGAGTKISKDVLEDQELDTADLAKIAELLAAEQQAGNGALLDKINELAGASALAAGGTSKAEAVQEAKNYVDTTLQALGVEAKIDTKIAEAVESLTNSASSDYNTFKEIEDAIKRNANSLSLLTNVTKKFKATVGDGQATEHTVTHNLNEIHPSVTLYLDNEIVLADVKVVDANSIKVVTAKPVTQDALTVVVIG